MIEPQIDDVVRLTEDFPELFLPRGAIGVVRSVWFAPMLAYEVEFRLSPHDCHTRALLFRQHIQLESASDVPPHC